MQDVNKYDSIDLVRAIAILLVILTHSDMGAPDLPPVFEALFNFGKMGVQLFFVASAFTLCLSMRARSGDTLSNFYLRRFFRIAPLFYIGILFYLLWRTLRFYSFGMETAQSYDLVFVLSNTLFLHGFNPGSINLVPGGWSIAVEMMFYSFFPFLFAWARGLELRRYAFVTAAVFVLLVLGQYVFFNFISPRVLGRSFANDEFGFFYTSIINQLPVFMVGIVFFFLRDWKPGGAARALGVVLIGLCLFVMNDRSLDTSVDGAIFPVLAALGFGILFLALFNTPNLAFLGMGFLVSLGRRSFSMYIFHFFILDLFLRLLALTPVNLPPLALGLVSFTVTTLLSYGVAGLSWTYIERPGIQWGNRLISKRQPLTHTAIQHVSEPVERRSTLE